MEELKRYEDVFSIPVQGANGQEMYLEQFRGKVLMFINTTGHCGNTSQWPVLDALQEEYKDKPFQIVYVPTNDYCGSVTFGEYKKGIKNGQESADYAKKTFGIEAPFTELLSSRNEP
jgi:glutathione peroxidase-family protein